MFVREAAQAKLLDSERNKFLHEQWPDVVQRISQLGLDPAKLINDIDKDKS